MKKMALTLVAVAFVCVHAQEKARQGELEQAQKQIEQKIQAQLSDLPQETQNKLEKAVQSRDEVRKMGAQGEAYVNQCREQNEQRMETEISDLPERTQQKVRAAVEDAKQSKEQKQVQLKEMTQQKN